MLRYAHSARHILAIMMFLAVFLSVSAAAEAIPPVTGVSFGAEGGNLQNGGAWNFSGLLYGLSAPDGAIGLYAISEDGSRTRLAEGYASQVNVLDGFVYYLSLPNPAKESGTIWRVPADGSAAPVQLSKDKAIFLLAAGDRLYYTLDGSNNLCSIMLDGSGKQVLMKGKCGRLCGEGGTLYFENDGKKTLCALDIASGGITSVKLDYSGYGQVMDGAFYYRNAKKQLCRCAPDGTDVQVLHKGPIGALNASGGVLYFADAGNGSFPCSILPDGTGLAVLADIPVDFIEKTGSSLYLINRKKASIMILGTDGILTPAQ